MLVVLALAIAVAAVMVVKAGHRPQPLDVDAVADQSQTDLPLLVDVGADNCIACKMMTPILEELRREFAGRLEVVFVDVWQNRAAAGQYGITVIPTQIFYDGQGEELFRHEGFFSKDDILAVWREHGYFPEEKPSSRPQQGT